MFKEKINIINDYIKIKFCGGVSSVTGANFLLEYSVNDNVKRILIDCGMEQGSEKAKEHNQKPFSYNPSSIDYLFVTHAHMDHIGLIPKLIKDGFKGVIYSTPETRDLSIYMLEDALKLVTQEAAHNKKEPLYIADDVAHAFELWETVHYHAEFKFDDNISVYLKDAGHVLGSSMFMFAIDAGGKKHNITFTGDLGNSPSPILKDTETIEGAEYLIMESVYGDRNHEDKETRLDKLKNAIEDITNIGGVLLIPTFSLEKSQELLYEMNKLFEDGIVKPIPVYLDSPLASKLIPIYKKYQDDYNLIAKKRRKKGDDIFDFKNLTIIGSSEESKALLHSKNPKIIMAGSGMSTGGRIQHHELNYLGHKNTIILFMGFQALGTLGRSILDGQKKVNIYGVEIDIHAEVRLIDGYSGHKDSDHLQEFVTTAGDSLKKVYVTMGEQKAALFLVQRLRDYYDIDATHPEEGDEIRIL